MRKSVTLLLVASLAVSACGFRDSRLNPANWFGRGQSVPVETAANTNPLIPQRAGLFAGFRPEPEAYDGVPFEQVSGLVIERVPGGAVIRATGLAARQGYYEVRLIPDTEDETPVDGVLGYTLESLRPATRTAVGTPPTREVVAARKVTDQQLAGVRAIRVAGQFNAQIARR